MKKTHGASVRSKKKAAVFAIKLDKVSQAPGALKDGYLWADRVELLCLISPDKEITKTNVIDRFKLTVNDCGPEVDDNEDEDVAATEEDDPDKRGGDDDWSQRVDNWFRILQFRSGTFGTSYPFTFKDGKLVAVSLSDATDLQKLYCFLLAGSQLSIFEKGYATKLTHAFEAISALAASSLLPKNANVHLFGKSSYTDSRYTGILRKKVQKLAKDLGETLLPRISFADDDSGDNGLDLVGWIEHGDELDGRFMFFGQCGCSATEWSAKQHSSAYSAWSSVMTLAVYPLNLIFIPFSFRNADGDWHDRRDIQKSLLLDRHRITFHLKGQTEKAIKIKEISVANELLAFKEKAY